MSKVQSPNQESQRRTQTRPRYKKGFGLWTLDFGLLLILVWAGGVHAQDKKCTLKLSELPESAELFGFRMGMTMEQVTARVPQIVFGRTNEFGLAQTSISPDFDQRFNKASFSGIRTVSLDFLDNRLTSIWFGYDGTFKWQTVADFVKGISRSLRLPDAWNSWKIRGQQLVCADFQMTVSLVGEGPSFHIIDSAAEQTIAERREAKEELDSSNEETPSEEVIADKRARVYYAEGCQPPQAIKEADRIVFKSIEDAEKAGYKLAKSCQ